MINRRYLRTKVMQAIYAHAIIGNENIVAGEKKLDQAIHSCYTLFLTFVAIFPELKISRLRKFEELKTKINPSFEDINPNTKFVDNKVIEFIEENVLLNRLWKENKINPFVNQKDIVIKIFQEIVDTEEYQNYMQHEERSFSEDKKLILFIIEGVFADSTLLHWFLEEINVNWFDDYNVALLMLYKNINSFTEKKGALNKILPIFQDAEEDVPFYKDLYRKTVINNDYYESLIEPKLQNWEKERVNMMDMILLKMAICELIEFPTIPVKVIINEYIELAKNYSSLKSGSFINGLLDQVIQQLREEGKLHKIGRGLIEN
ncbi:MAG: transcription antitermination factor NusB [Bacteroidales bacterium]|jgi:N utilization substance protein B|nr:transcription antitermination factor NusB [Bacteroidales bacterium]